MKIKHDTDQIVLLDDNEQEMGELKYITIDDEIILMGTFVNNHYRGNGYFNVLLNELVKTFYNKVIYICCVVSYIFLSIERLGFKQTDESIPYWGLMSNGTNFKYTPSFTPSITPS